MFRFGMKSDTIQFWILIVTGLGLLASFAGWADARYAKADKVADLSWMVHAVYSKVLTPDERSRAERERDAAESR